MLYNGLVECLCSVTFGIGEPGLRVKALGGSY